MQERLPVSEAYNMDCMEYMRTLPDKAFDLEPSRGAGQNWQSALTINP